MSNYNVAWKECPTCTEGQISPTSGLPICRNCAGLLSYETLDLMRRTGLVPTEMLNQVKTDQPTYRVTDKLGHEIHKGDTITDFHGSRETFSYVSRGIEYNGTAKVVTGAGHEYYANVFDLTVETL